MSTPNGTNPIDSAAKEVGGRSDRGGQRKRRPGGRRRRRSRNRPVPEDLKEADSLEDGHERIICPREAGAEIYGEDDHDLDMGGIDPDATKVLRRLARHGFQAYLVGGCVRDLLIGGHPKDFDIATSATPRQIRRLFRNSRVIGRRFRLVHIHFGDNILEVSTFRRNASKEEAEESDDPLIRRDNVFGRADEDAQRRDFTINALFFDIKSREVIDFVGGMKDLRARRIETIGEPVTRLREDPVRMLRAAKFAGRLGFDLAEDLFDAIYEVREDLSKAAAPRLYEEIQRLLERGGSSRSFDILYETHLLDILIPEIARHLDVENEDEENEEESCFWRVLSALDRREEAGLPVSHVLRLSALFLSLFDKILPHRGPTPTDEPPVHYDIVAMVDRLLDPVAARLQMPRRDLFRIKQAIIGLRRLLARRQRGRRPGPNQIVKREYFPDAVRLLGLYSGSQGRYQDLYHSWLRRYEDVTDKTLE